MKRRPDNPEDSEEPLLFDLPLGGPDRLDDEPEELPRERKRPARQAPVPPEPPLSRSRPVPVPDPEDDFESDDEPVARDGAAGRARRLAAGLADLVVHAALVVAAVLGVQALGIRPDLAHWPAYATFLVAFSFLYTVLPLAFWGHTPGMAWTGITSRNQDGEALTFDQTARRWLGGLVTTLLAGLPLLVLVKGRSLADLVSGSATYLADDAE